MDGAGDVVEDARATDESHILGDARSVPWLAGGIATGMLVGLPLGAVLGDYPLGVGVGLAAGIAAGTAMDLTAREDAEGAAEESLRIE